MFTALPKVRPGDRVAVVSPSTAAPARFPAVHALAMRRLREEFGLEPVEYPTTRRPDASPQDRAADLMAAFADPGIRAVLATIGGDDQITVLPYLDPGVVVACPKPFAGYSDNTNLLNWLWNLGVPSYHGGSTMVHLGRGGRLHPASSGSLRAALIDGGDLDLRPVDVFNEDELDWNDPEALGQEPSTQPAPGWIWHQPGRMVTGPAWGGCLEILHWNLAAGRWIRPAEDYAGCVLLLETSEEMPSAEETFRMLRNFGERGLVDTPGQQGVLEPFAGLGGQLRDGPAGPAVGAFAVAEGVQEHVRELVQDVPVDVPGHDRGQRRVTGGGGSVGPGQVYRSRYLRGGGAGGAPARLQPGGAGQAVQLGQVHVHGQLGRLAVGAGQHPGIDQPLAALVARLHRDLGHIGLPHRQQAQSRRRGRADRRRERGRGP